MSNNVKIIIIGALVLVSLALPYQANAGSGWLDTLLDPTQLVGSIARVIGAILNYIVGIFFVLAGFLVDLVMDLNMSIGGSQNALVGVGWGIVRDIANLGFVLAIIIISFATIFRYKEYGARQLLVRLVTAALLVNFSLTIAMFFVDFSNVVTKFFVGNRLGNAELSENLAAAFGTHRLLIGGEDSQFLPPDPEETGAISGSSLVALFLNLSGIFFGIIFTALAAFVLFALALMLLIRFVILSLLLILAPISWMFWVMPQWKGLFKSWWDSFLKWTFFAPAASFFIYIALLAVQLLPQEPLRLFESKWGVSAVLKSVMTQGSQMIITAGLLLGGIIAADRMGIHGAKYARELSSAAGSKTKEFLGKAAKRARDRALTAGTNEETGKSALERAGDRFRQTPLIGRAVTGISGASSRARSRIKSEAEEAKNKMAGRTKEDNVANLSHTINTASAGETAGRTIQVAEQGGWGELNDYTKERAIQAIQRAGLGEELLAVDPTLANRFGTNTADAVTQHVTDAAKLPSEVLTNPEVIAALKQRHLKQVGDQATYETKINIVNNIRETMGPSGQNYMNFKKDLDKTLKDLEDAKATGNQNKIKSIIARRNSIQGNMDSIMGGLNEESKKALSDYQFITKDNNWRDVI